MNRACCKKQKWRAASVPDVGDGVLDVPAGVDIISTKSAANSGNISNSPHYFSQSQASLPGGREGRPYVIASSFEQYHAFCNAPVFLMVDARGVSVIALPDGARAGFVQMHEINEILVREGIKAGIVGADGLDAAARGEGA